MNEFSSAESKWSSPVTLLILLSVATQSAHLYAKPTATKRAASSGDRYVDGIEHLAAGRFQEAVDAFSDVIADDPKNVKAFQGRARAYKELESQATNDTKRDQLFLKALDDSEMAKELVAESTVVTDTPREPSYFPFLILAAYMMSWVIIALLFQRKGLDRQWVVVGFLFGPIALPFLLGAILFTDDPDDPDADKDYAVSGLEKQLQMRKGPRSSRINRDVRPCPNCGRELAVTSRICPRCETKL